MASGTTEPSTREKRKDAVPMSEKMTQHIHGGLTWEEATTCRQRVGIILDSKWFDKFIIILVGIDVAQCMVEAAMDEGYICLGGHPMPSSSLTVPEMASLSVASQEYENRSAKRQGRLATITNNGVDGRTPSLLSTDSSLGRANVKPGSANDKAGFLASSIEPHEDVAYKLCEEHGPKNQRLDKISRILAYSILGIMLGEICFKAWSDPEYFSANPLHILDLVVVSLSAVLLAVIHLGELTGWRSIVRIVTSALLLSRLWRVVRIISGFIFFQEALALAEDLQIAKEFIKDHQLLEQFDLFRTRQRALAAEAAGAA